MITDGDVRILIDEIVSRSSEVTRTPRIRVGTVVGAGDIHANGNLRAKPIPVRMDGDEETIFLQSIIGPVTANERVVVYFYPPAGAVIIGSYNDWVWRWVGTTVETSNPVRYVNSWADYLNGYQHTTWRRYPNGIVRLRGHMQGGVIGSVAFTLPADSRPPLQLSFSVPSGASGTGRLEVLANGQVIPVSGDNSFFALNVDWAVETVSRG